ncbi:MAG: methyltransferase domain-containing protein [Anaerolineae bacterium]|nr:methyltransferase domain-containing protein [Anaerolineae bacterium]
MEPALTPAEWAEHFRRQAEWTRAARNYLYRRADLLRARRVLDVGCGTGVITEEMAARTRGRVVGLDINPQFLRLREGRGADYILGGALCLPFASGAFDVVVCHFVLMWLRDPRRGMAEMVRVTRAGGWVLLCAEPDYGARLDYPDLPHAAWHIEALRREGADPFMGRKLRALCAEQGLGAEVGCLSAPWTAEAIRDSLDGEWAMLTRITREFVGENERRAVRAREEVAIARGERFVFMPVFYAAARVPG